MADHHDDSFNSLIATANGLVAKPDLHPRLQQKENQLKYYLLLNSADFGNPQDEEVDGFSNAHKKLHICIRVINTMLFLLVLNISGYPRPQPDAHTH